MGKRYSLILRGLSNYERVLFQMVSNGKGCIYTLLTKSEYFSPFTEKKNAPKLDHKGM
jgi:hypothetical protein